MITWTEQYNIYSAPLAGGVLTMTVAWNSTAPRGSPSGYKVYVGSRRLKTLFRDVESGKAAALTLARRIVRELEAELLEEPTGGRRP